MLAVVYQRRGWPWSAITPSTPGTEVSCVLSEYLYQVLRNHASCGLPEEGLAMIRYHSFYLWH